MSLTAPIRLRISALSLCWSDENQFFNLLKKINNNSGISWTWVSKIPLMIIAFYSRLQSWDSKQAGNEPVFMFLKSWNFESKSYCSLVIRFAWVATTTILLDLWFCKDTSLCRGKMSHFWGDKRISHQKRRRVRWKCTCWIFLLWWCVCWKGEIEPVWCYSREEEQLSRLLAHKRDKHLF